MDFCYDFWKVACLLCYFLYVKVMNGDGTEPAESGTPEGKLSTPHHLYNNPGAATIPPITLLHRISTSPPQPAPVPQKVQHLT